MNSTRRSEHHRRLQRLREAAGLQTHEAVLEGLYLRYALRPGTGEPLLLCNGIGANLELTLPLVQALPQRPVIIVDLPGTGGSPAGWFWPSFPRYARMLGQVLAQLDISGRFAVAGVSWGGALAQQMARDYAGRVTHLILMATSPGITMMPGRMSALRHMITPQRYTSRRYLARHAGSLYGGEMRGGGDRLRQHAHLISAPTGLAYVQQLLAMYQFSSLPWLHRIRCPALVISGDDDPLIRPFNARLLARLLPQARLEILPGAGHLFMNQRAAETAALIGAFLDEEGRDDGV